MQYGIRIKSEDFRSLDWDEFCDLLSGLNEKTPLARIIQIRTEEDKDILKEYTPEQRRIRADWQKRTALRRSQQEVDEFLKNMQEVFQNMSEETPGIIEEGGVANG